MKFYYHQLFKYSILTFLIFISSFSFAQERLLHKAQTLYLQHQTNKAIKICNKGIKRYPNYAKFYFLCAKIYYKQGQSQAVIHYLKKYYALSKDAKALSEIGFEFFGQKQYDSAIFYFEKYQKNNYSPDIQHYIDVAKFRIYALQSPVPFTPKRLPNTINTSFDEYFPAITANNVLYFTRFTENENIYFSQKKGSNWLESKPLPQNINTKYQEGACTISSDGKTLIFTRCIPNIGCDLYISHKNDTGWTNPQKLPYPINTRYWESQPCLANNGQTLFFTSNRPGGKGDMDIWAIDYIQGKWLNLRNLGDSINTKGKEMSPFLHFDGKTLYFASNYHPGLGGFDLFVSRYKNGHWTKPKNLGYPINSSKDDVRLIVEVNGKTAYFSSAISGNQDIYTFTLYPKIRPLPVIYISGQIVDSITKNPLTAQVSIFNLKNNNRVFSSFTQTFTITLAAGDYALFAERQGYMFYSKNFSIADTNRNYTKHLKIELLPIAPNATMILHNIFFDFNSYTLKPQSYVELKKLVHFLLENPSIKIEIQGHTDNIGSQSYNLKLSQQRAETVRTYLIKHGISPDRLIAKGYGDSKPIASNTTSQGRALNRRVEIKIIKL